MALHDPSSPAPESGHPGRRRFLSSRGAMTALVLVAAASVIAGGAYATFTDTENATPTIGSGTVDLDPIGTSAVNNRLSVGATDIAAGDTLQRTVDIKNVGTIALTDITLTTTATTSSLLDTDTTDGLQLEIDLCSQAWTESGPPYTYTCGGSTSTVLASRPVIGSTLALSNLDLTANTDNYARVTLTLPSGAPNALQNQTSVINFAFTATQRSATSQ